MEFSILTKVERERLRKVKTTQKQAEQVLKRCQPLSAFLHALPRRLREIQRSAKRAPTSRFRGNVGCPHCYLSACDGSNACIRCAWAALRVPRKGNNINHCTLIPFGGITWQRAFRQFFVNVELYEGHEVAAANSHEVKRASHAAKWRKNLDDAILHVDGHIEWANGVLTGEL